MTQLLSPLAFLKWQISQAEGQYHTTQALLDVNHFKDKQKAVKLAQQALLNQISQFKLQLAEYSSNNH